MVPLIMSTNTKPNFYQEEFNENQTSASGEPRYKQCNPNSPSLAQSYEKQSSALEEFATHLSLYDDAINFAEKCSTSSLLCYGSNTVEVGKFLFYASLNLLFKKLILVLFDVLTCAEFTYSYASYA